jgi:dTDP-4-dehydrorhamnose 3,5-epimerase
MERIDTNLPGLVALRPRVFQDQRGALVKTFHAGQFAGLGIEFEPREEFFSTSARDVLRGLHFQLPPAAHAKLVYCIVGRVLDVVVDLRRQSGTYGQWHARELGASNREMLFIPVGFAHGFLSLEDGSTMVYQTSTVHSPAHDAGVRWDSIEFDWPAIRPVLSDRDQQFPPLEEFESPF